MVTIKINHFLLFIFAVLAITRITHSVPRDFLHVQGLLWIYDIGILLSLILSIDLFILKKEESGIPRKIKSAYLILIFYVAFELIRTLILYDQKLFTTLQTQRSLFYGIFIFIVPLILTNKLKILKTIQILFFTSVICSTIFLYQVLTKNMIYDVFYVLQNVGGFIVLRTFENFPTVLIFISFGLVFWLINYKDLIYRRILFLVLVLLSLFIVVINATRGQWVVYAFCLFLTVSLSNKVKLKSLVVLVLLIAVLLVPFGSNFIESRVTELKNDVVHKEGTFGYRIDVFKERLEMIRDFNLLLGVGLVNYETHKFDNYFIAGGTNSNNRFVNHGDIGFAGLFGQLGIIGAMLFSYLIISCLRYIYSVLSKSKDKFYKTVLVAIFCSSVWVILSTINGPGFYGEDLFFIFFFTGLSKSIKTLENGRRLNK